MKSSDPKSQDYNVGVHKGENMAFTLIGWGVWVVAVRPLANTSGDFSEFPNIADGAFIGAVYAAVGCVGFLCFRIDRAKLGLSLIFGAFASIVFFFAAGCVYKARATGDYVHHWSTAIYTYGVLALITLSAIRDYIRGK